MANAARLVVMYVHALCREHYTKDFRGNMVEAPVNIASHHLTGGWADVFDFKSNGTHKYIPSLEKVNADLECEPGAGVFAYFKMYDDSYVFLTCKGPLAFWTGKDEDKAQWGE